MDGILNMSRYSVAVWLLVLILVLHDQTSHANNNYSTECTSSCGNIHNITYPFRLTSDPIHCGHESFELVCHHNLTLVLYMDVVKYYVQAINRNNLTIRFRKADLQLHNCSSFPQFYDIYYFSQHSMYMQIYMLDRRIIILECAKAVNSALYKEISSPYCTNPQHNVSSSSNFKAFSYLLIFGNEMVYAGDLEDSCRVKSITLTSSLLSIHNYDDVYKSLLYGFELSWHTACCDNIDRKNPCNLDYFARHYFCYYRRYSTFYRFLLWLLQNLAVTLSFFYDLFTDRGRYVLNYLKTYYLSYKQLFSGKYAFFQYLVPFSCDLLLLLVLFRIFLLCFGTPFVIIFLIYKWRRRHLSVYQSIEEFLQSQNNLMPIRYSYYNIKKITKGFKDKLGEGGYGSVYKGKLRSGDLVAIKILNKSKSNGQDFINEVATIGTIHHVNVVRLIGFCVEGSKRALVYEFMPNGSLDKYIFCQERGIQVNEKKLFEISIGIARGIEYLHQGCNIQILHFDIKPHNILLGENFNPKISDFGLAKSCSTDDSIVSLTTARGTFGYMAPELHYKNIGGISYKADVYSFGMLLLEMAGRRKNLNAFAEKSSQIYFPSWAYNQLNEGKTITLEHTTEEEKKATKKMIIIALWCIQLKPADRPSMHKVIQMFEDEEQLKMPPNPFTSTCVMVDDDTHNTWPTSIATLSNDNNEDSISLLANAN